MRTIDIPRTMKAAVLYDVDDVRIEERPVPALETGDVLVRMGASGVCSGDLVPWYVRRKAPFVFGHEPAGTVVAVGPGSSAADEALLGAPVFAHHHAPCLSCGFCERGDYVQCARWRTTSLDPGAMAEYFRVPKENRAEILRLPSDMSFVTGALIEPLACVVKSLGRAAGTPVSLRGSSPEPMLAESTVYVIGLGIMGLMHVALARALGARVLACDFIEARRALASDLGATALDPRRALERLCDATAGHGADVVICGPGTASALQHAFEAASGGAAIVTFAPFDPEERFELDQHAVYFRDLRLFGSYSCGPGDTATALRLLEHGIIVSDKFGIVTWPLSHVTTAYEHMRTQAVVKAVIVNET